ncbi:MAG: flagellar hook-basal body complex protein FliE [Leptospiraceae bacterium]|nr:flagellar hook-basal body complex protein FliE [Leptospiraceae bacterium]MCK6380386.1 flagellar hook-basal body complex protein FliE [Leptospiraceae bacterium]NUM41777.1 flagellar hook-basal body complex protein FliE [Leptospiraceae bacterium]
MNISFNSNTNLYNSGKPFSITPVGDKVSVNVTDTRHYGDKASVQSPDDVAESFASVLKKSFENVNDAQVQADEMTQKLVFDPNSVDAHDVMIAAEKARISLTFTKTLADGFVRAYRELTSLR